MSGMDARSNDQLTTNSLTIKEFQHPPKQKAPAKGRGFSLQLVPETGVEPATYALRTQPTDSGERSKRLATDRMSPTPDDQTGMDRWRRDAL